MRNRNRKLKWYGLAWLGLAIAAGGTITIANAEFNSPGIAPGFTRGFLSPQQWLGNYGYGTLTNWSVWQGAKYFNLGTITATITPNFCLYANATVTLGATGMTMANPTCINEGQTFTVRLVEDGTGSRTITTWGSFYKFSGGTKPTLTTTAGAFDFLMCTAQPGATTGVCSAIANPS